MRLGYPNRPASDDMVTMEAASDALSSGMARFVTRKVPCRFTSTTARQSSKGELVDGCGWLLRCRRC
jgi:hypothetical protein